MVNKKQIQFTSGIILIATLFAFNGQVQAGLSVGVDSSFANWKGDVDGNSYESDSHTGSYGVNLKIQIYDLYVGADYLSGRYEFDLPNVPGAGSAIPDEKIDREELNLVAGYYVFRNLSVFAKYKSLHFNNGDSYHSDLPGLGAQLHWTISSNWLVFANTAIFTGNFSVDDNNAGDLDIIESALGFAFRPTIHSHVIVAYRRQDQDFDYNSGRSENQVLSGPFVGYNYMF